MKHSDHAVVAAPFGRLELLFADGELISSEFLMTETPLVAAEGAAGRAICERLQAYFEGRDALQGLPVMAHGTLFQQRVWQALQQIPYGATLTYTQLAERVDSGPRAVANACGANPIALFIPCHRVVAKEGLGGFMQGRTSGSLSIKQWLLNHERNQSSPA
jgi:methylated-DNA-[protein]-cysteine S-methyltransferase